MPSERRDKRRTGLGSRQVRPRFRMEKLITTTEMNATLAMSDEFEQIVRRHVDGAASDDEAEMLAANQRLWIRGLYRLLDDVAETIDDLRSAVKGHQRVMIVNDIESDYDRIERVLTKLVGPPLVPVVDERSDVEATGPAQLQLSWVPGRVIAWAGGAGARAEGMEEIIERLREAGGGSVEWEEHRTVKLPSGSRADAVSAPVESCLGWLVALGATADDDDSGASVAPAGLHSTPYTPRSCRRR